MCSTAARSTRSTFTLLLTAALLMVSVWKAPPALAGVSIAATVNFPSSVTTGQTNVPASISVVNNSYSTHATGSVTITSLKLVPSCSTAGDPGCDAASSVADPGAFTLAGTGTGRTGTACAGRVFNITVAAPTGEVVFVPADGAPLSIGAPSATSDLDACTIDFTFSVNRVPNRDVNTTTSGYQTYQAAFALGTHAASGIPANTFATDLTTVVATEPAVTITTTASPLTREAPGGEFTYSVSVTNSGPVGVTITSLTDDIYGDLATRPGTNTCDDLIGDPLAPGATVECAFAGSFTASGAASQTNVTTVEVSDGANTATDSDEATVTLTAPPPPIPTIDLTVRPQSRPAPGGNFTYSIIVSNTGTVPFVITSMVDNIYGSFADINGSNTCDDLLGDVVAVGSSTAPCSFVGAFNGLAGATQTNVVTVVVTNPTGQTGTDTDDAVVKIGISAVGDFDGSGNTDLAVWRPSTGQWFVKDLLTQNWGLPNDVPVAGDYDGSGDSDIGVWRPSTGQWFIQGRSIVSWGLPNDLPVPGDYDGNGTTDIAVWRPSTGQWFIQNRPPVSWGVNGDVPVPADYDGNGTTDIAVWRPSSGAWYVQNQFTTSWGLSGDIPVPGDYNGDGAAEVAVWRPSTGQWFVFNGGIVSWGVPGDIPVPADYNGDAATDRAVYRDGRWLFKYNGSSVNFGLDGDVPAQLPPAIYLTYFD